MFKVAIGHTEDPDSEDAIADVITQCKETLNNVKPTAGFLFAFTDYDYPILLEAVNKEFPDIELIGGSTVAELSSVLGYQTGTLELVLFATDKIEIKGALIPDLSKDFDVEVKAALSEVLPKMKEKPSFCVITSQSLKSGPAALVKAIRAELGDTFPIIGGGTSSNLDTLDDIRQFYKTEIYDNCAPILFFSGPIDISIGVANGWTPFTPFHQLNEAKLNVVYKISEKSSLDFYLSYLGENPTLIHPLAVFEDSDEEYYLRGPLFCDETDGSIAFTADFPETAKIRIAKSSPDQILQATEDSPNQAVSLYPNQSYQCAFIISCICRKAILGTRTEEEYRKIRKQIPKDIPIFGFYGCGQFGPYSQGDLAVFHSETLVTVLIGEKDVVA